MRRASSIGIRSPGTARDGTKLTPKYGYNAPPLDGIWATAPYLHNGSIPTLEGVIDSTKRPKFWTWSFDSKDYDVARMGLPFEAVDHGQAKEWVPWRVGKLYDTTLEGHSNAGHTYGDNLTSDDRAALLEYMKTL